MFSPSCQNNVGDTIIHFTPQFVEKTVLPAHTRNPNTKKRVVNGTVVPLPTNAATFPLQARHHRATINNTLPRQETATKRRLPSAAKNLNPQNQSYRKENS